MAPVSGIVNAKFGDALTIFLQSNFGLIAEVKPSHVWIGRHRTF